MFTPLMLVVLFDGLGHNEFIKYHEQYGNLTKLRKECVSTKNGVIPVFPSMTVPNLMSISTGLYVESHGLQGNIIHPRSVDEKHNQSIFALFTDSDEDGTWWDNNVSLPIWTLNEMSSMASSRRYSGGMLWAGSGAKYRTKRIRYYEPYAVNASWHEEVDFVMDWFTDDHEPANCVFLYFDEPDLTNHAYGPNSPQVKVQMQRVNDIVGYLLDKVEENGLKDSLNIIFTSDHGVIEIPPGNFNEISQLNISKNLYQVLSNSAIWHIDPLPDYFDMVYKTFQEGSKIMNYTFWLRDDFPESAHLKNGKYVGAMILVSDVGFKTVPVVHPDLKAKATGNHGYNNTHPSMRSFFLAKGPVFNTSVILDSFKNVDLYPLMCHILNLQPGPNNGSFDSVSLMLKLNQDHSDIGGKPFDYTAIGVGITLVIIVVIILILFGYRMFKKQRQFHNIKYGLVAPEPLLSDTDSDGL